MKLTLRNHAAFVTKFDSEEQLFALCDLVTFESEEYNPFKKRMGVNRKCMFNLMNYSFPIGIAPLVIQMLRELGHEVELANERCTVGDPPDLNILNDLFYEPYPFQRAGIGAALSMGIGIIKAPVGSGKTLLGVGIMAAKQDINWVVFCPKDSLVTQWAAEYELNLQEKVGVISSTAFKPARVTIMTFSQARSKADRIDPILKAAGGFILDECFPAGTLVGGVPIETVRVGDVVPSYDEVTATFATRKVVRVFKSYAAATLKVYSGTRSVVCTPDHPFLTKKGWLPARLIEGEEILYASTVDGVQVPGMQLPCVGALPKQEVHTEMQAVPKSRRGTGAARSVGECQPNTLRRVLCARTGKVEDGVRPCPQQGSCAELFQGVLTEGKSSPVTSEVGHEDRGGESCVCSSIECSDDSCQPDGSHRYTGKGSRDQAEERDTPAFYKRGERPRIDNAAENVSGNAGRSGDRIRCKDKSVESPENLRAPLRAVSLQSRCGHPGSAFSYRSGREVPQLRHQESPGRTQGPMASWQRVDRVEVQEQRDTDQPGESSGMCAVYNLEVEGTHTYLANGFVVHNCHSSGATTHLAIIEKCVNAYFRIGLSATPLDRSDKKTMAVLAATGPLIFEISTEELLELKLVSKPIIRMVRYKHDKAHDTKATAALKEPAAIYRARIVNNKERNALIAKVIEIAAKPNMTFLLRNEHVDSVYNDVVKTSFFSAAHIDQHASMTRRDETLDKLRKNRLDICVTSGVFQDGVSVKNLASVVVGTGYASVLAAIQRLGRGSRVTDEKTEFELWDIADEGCYGERHTNARVAAYEREGYEVTFISAEELEDMWRAIN